MNLRISLLGKSNWMFRNHCQIPILGGSVVMVSFDSYEPFPALISLIMFPSGWWTCSN